MLAIIIQSTICIFCFFAIGHFFNERFKISFGYTDTLLLGIIYCNSIIGFASLVTPIESGVLILMLLFSVLVFPYKALISFKKDLVISSPPWIPILPIIILLVLLSLNKFLNYDTYLYHLQSIQWIQKFPAVPGLGNLHARLAFNPNTFLLNALFDVRQILPQDVFSLNLILCLVVLRKIWSWLLPGNFSSRLMYFSAYIVLLLALLTLPNIQNCSPDYPVTVLSIFILGSLIRQVELNRPIQKSQVILLTTLVVYAGTIKLSAMPLFVLIPFLFSYKEILNGKTIFIAILLSSVIILPWLARNVILSGWPLFPLDRLGFHFLDWMIPENQVVATRNDIIGWARNPGTTYLQSVNEPLQEWIPLWWSNQTVLRKFILSGSFLSLFLTVGVMVLNFRKVLRLHFALTCTAISGVAFWFFSAPDFRFGITFLVLGYGCLFLMISSFKINFRLPGIRSWMLAFFASTVLVSVNRYDYRRIILGLANRDGMILPLSENWNPEFISVELRGSNQNILVPKNGDQCFQYEIPCTPKIEYGLIQRSSKLSDGFRIDAEFN